MAARGKTALNQVRGHALRTARSDSDTLLVDFDGTICETARAVRFSLGAAFSRIGVEIPASNRVEVSIASGCTLQETIKILHPNSDISNEEIVRIENEYRNVYSSDGYKYEALLAAAEATLEECSRHANVIILSNKGLKAIEAALGRFGLRQYVCAVIAGGPGAPRKPDARLFRAVQRQVCSVRHERSLMVGDTETDLRFARNSGLQSCWATYGYGHSARCRMVGFDYVLDRLENLPGILHQWSVRRRSRPPDPRE